MSKRSRQQVLDPAVAEMLGHFDKKQRLARMPAAQRAKARRDAKRSRVTLDLPEPIQQALDEIAKKEGVSASSLAALILSRGIREYRAGGLQLADFKRPSRSPRFEFVLAIDGNDDDRS